VRTRRSRGAAACHLWNMQTVYEAAGGTDGLLRLASAWHARVMADEVVSHAFSHGFHPGAHPAARCLLGGIPRWPNDVFRLLRRRDLCGAAA
jgi:hypothetical protein